MILNEVVLKYWIGILLIIFFLYSIFFLNISPCLLFKPFLFSDITVLKQPTKKIVKIFYSNFWYDFDLKNQEYSYIPEDRSVFFPEDIKDCTRMRFGDLITCQAWYLLHFLSMNPISKDLYIESPLDDLKMFSNFWYFKDILYVEMYDTFLQDMDSEELAFLKSSIEKTILFNLRTVKKITWLEISL